MITNRGKKGEEGTPTYKAIIARAKLTLNSQVTLLTLQTHKPLHLTVKLQNE